MARSNVKTSNVGETSAGHFSGNALTEIDAFFRKSGKVIIPLTVMDILEEQLAKKLA